MSDGTALLEVEGVSKRFGSSYAVSEVSLSVTAGEILAIIGPNGAGKTTLFGVISGEHRASQGRVVFGSSEVTGWSAHRRARDGMSRTFQVARLFPTLGVVDHLALAISAKEGSHRRLFDNFDATARSQSELIESTLAGLRLEHVRNEIAGDLPQGDRKRLELAMAMIQGPRLLLLDEPTAGMSNADCDLTVELLTGIAEANPNLGIVMTGHDMRVLLALASRVLLMAEGKKMIDGPPEEIRASALVRQLYLGDESV